MRKVADLSWDRDQRFFDAAAVGALVDVIQPVARRIGGETWREVRVRASIKGGDYRLPHKYGRSVTLSTGEN